MSFFDNIFNSFNNQGLGGNYEEYLELLKNSPYYQYQYAQKNQQQQYTSNKIHDPNAIDGECQIIEEKFILEDFSKQKE